MPLLEPLKKSLELFCLLDMDAYGIHYAHPSGMGDSCDFCPKAVQTIMQPTGCLSRKQLFRIATRELFAVAFPRACSESLELGFHEIQQIRAEKGII